MSDKLIMDATNLYLQIILPISPRAPGFCIFARRAVHQTIGGFDETLKMSEDHDYVRRASQHGPFGLLTSTRIPVSMRPWKKKGWLAWRSNIYGVKCTRWQANLFALCRSNMSSEHFNPHQHLKRGA